MKRLGTFCQSSFFVCAFIGLSACATSAPPLPADTTSINRQNSISIRDFSSSDAAMNCQAIAAEQKNNIAKMELDNKAIEANRKQNEIAGYLGAIVVLPIVATEGNYTEKDDIVAIQTRQDTLVKLSTIKKCQ